MIANFGFWILDFGFWILDFGFWILDYFVTTRFRCFSPRVARAETSVLSKPEFSPGTIQNPKSQIQNRLAY
jgi:hypothetical protein